MLKSKLIALWQEEEGLTVVEYAVAAGLISAVCVAAFQALGLTVAGIINFLNGTLAAVPGA